jgi:hypothetical protein
MRSVETLKPIIAEVEFLLAERRQLAAEGPHLIVTHGNHEYGFHCTRGETLQQVSFSYRWRESPLYLSPTGLLIFDCVCRYRQTPLTARRIEHILTSDPFYVNLGANAHFFKQKRVRPDHVAISVHMERIREQIAKAAGEVGFTVDPKRILVSERTESNIVLYRLKATVEIRHPQQQFSSHCRSRKRASP